MSKSVWLSLLIALLTVTSCYSNCNSTPADPNDGVDVTEELQDDEYVGSVRNLTITVRPRSNARLLADGKGVQVSVWFPDHPLGQTVEAQLDPNSNPARYRFRLGGAEALQICEKMMFRVSVTYDNTRLNNRGLYLGQETTIMPTKELVNPNQIRQATCAE